MVSSPSSSWRVGEHRPTLPGAGLPVEGEKQSRPPGVAGAPANGAKSTGPGHSGAEKAADARQQGAGSITAAVDEEVDVEGVLLGEENLPVVSTAGCLVLRPRQLIDPRRGAGGGCVNPKEDYLLPSAEEELCAWGTELDGAAPYRLFEAAEREKRLASYVAEEVARDPADPADAEKDLERARDLQRMAAVARTTEAAHVVPAQGPSLWQLFRDPSRREECPVCSAEWSQASRAPPPAAKPPEAPAAEGQEIVVIEAMPLPTRRAPLGARRGNGKAVHSFRCTWAWFQQNLCATLCALRFDSHGNPRHSPQNINNVLPPPIAEVWQYWRPKGARGRGDGLERERLAAERLARGEPVSG